MGNDFSVSVTKILSNAGKAFDQAMEQAFSVFDESVDRGFTSTEQVCKVTKETVDGVKRVVIEAEVPGCAKGDVDISTSGNMLNIRWTAKIDGSVRNYQFAIGSKADHDSISAKLENGYLTVIVQQKKDEKVETKKVRIE